MTISDAERVEGEVEIDETVTASAKDTITWDEFHNSPQAEIVLVSKDMVGFRVYAWYMKQKSDLIKDLVDLAIAPAEIAPIHLQFSANVIRHFIQCASSTEEFQFNLSATDYIQLFDLSNLLRASAIASTVLANVTGCMETKDYQGEPNAWEIFWWAAKRDDFALARSAICCLCYQGYDLRDLLIANPPSFYDEVPQDTFMPCFAARSPQSPHTRGGKDLPVIVCRYKIWSKCLKSSRWSRDCSTAVASVGHVIEMEWDAISLM